MKSYIKMLSPTPCLKKHHFLKVIENSMFHASLPALQQDKGVTYKVGITQNNFNSTFGDKYLPKM